MAKTKSTIPPYRRRSRQRGLPARIVIGLVRIVVGLIILSVLWVLVYRFVPPPITVTMLGDLFAGRGAARDWMPISQIDRDMVRAAIAAEDGKFCQHDGFDYEAIEDAMKRNASGGRIRGGSTISQQTAKNAFLWQGGGYVRKGAEAWFTLLIEKLWGKRRIMEVYLNLAETGIGTYGVNAGSLRYYGHDASAMSRTEAARIAAVLPLPKKRGVQSPKGFTRRYGGTISARIGQVSRDGLDACVYKGAVVAPDRSPPEPRGKPRPLPGDEYESVQALPPVEEPVLMPDETNLVTEPVLNELLPTEEPVTESASEPAPPAEEPPPPQQ